MFFYRIPTFESKRILKIPMLEELRDFPRDLLNISLKDNSNGILKGCDLLVNEDILVVTRGIILFSGNIYMLKENVNIGYRATNKSNILKVKFTGEDRNKDIIESMGEIYLDDDLNLQEDEIEICRFKLREGAKLRSEYVNFEDISTEYDTINIINTPYTSYKEESISPKLLEIYAKEAFKHRLIDPVDAAFILTLLKDKTIVSKDLLVNYIEYKLKVEVENRDNKTIYNYLIKILRNIKKEKDISHNKKLLSKGIILD